MVENSLFDPDFVSLLIYLFFCILGIIFFLILAYHQRKKSFELFITNKEEFLKNINLCFFKIGYHLELEKEGLIIYKKYFVRTGITFNQNKAILFGPGTAVKYLLDVYSGKRRVWGRKTWDIIVISVKKR